MSAEPAPLHGRIPQLDGLRGMAIFLVIIWHYVGITIDAPHGSPLRYFVASLNLTWSGVDLFFVLSGFLIGGILIDEQRAPRYFHAFYARRFFRIVPVYALVCGGFGLARLAGAQAWSPWTFANPAPWYAFVFFLQNVFVALRGTFAPLSLGVMWSLSVEEQFYTTLPMLVRWLPPRRLLPVLVAVVCAVPVVRTVAFYVAPHGPEVAYALMPLRADALLIGVIVAIVIRRPAWWAALVKHRGRLKMLAAFLGAGLVGLAGGYSFESKRMSTIGYTWLALFYAAVLVLAITRREGRLATFLCAGWLRRLGGIAYGSYLLHTLVQGLCFRVVTGGEPRITGARDLGITLLAAVMTVTVAQVSWTFFEKRMVRIGHRFRYDSIPQAATR